MSNNNLTFLFKNIFKDYDSFKDFLIEEEIYTADEYQEIHKWLFKVLFREYSDSSVMYDTINGFKADFANRYYDYFLRIKKTKDLIEKINNITDEELLIINESINNISNNDNSFESDIRKPLTYISSQNFSTATNNKLESYVKAINNMQTLQIKYILGVFRDLFIYIYNKEEYYY